jgi:hypothetical protein
MEEHCFLHCFICKNPPIAYANALKYHKLCEKHFNPIPSSQSICSICSSSVKIQDPKEIICDICKSSSSISLLTCGHSLCPDCLFNDDCGLCLTSCMNCSQECFVSTLICHHKLCQPCIATMRNPCEYCNPIKCLICDEKSLLGKDFCLKCESPCFICKSVKKIKISSLCKNLICRNCSSLENKCLNCSQHACSACSSSICNKKYHNICMKCTRMKIKCFKCYPNQKCSNCYKKTGTFDCDKTTHSLCVNCVVEHQGRKFCRLCDYHCCACGTKIPIIETNQYHCGHDICSPCLEKNSKDLCTICPKQRNSYQCEECHTQYWNIEGKYQILKCDNCGSKICTGCGKKIGFFGIFNTHQCSLGC